MLSSLILKVALLALIGFYLVIHPAQGSTSCAKSPQQLKDVLYNQQLTPDWAEYIQGHWSVRPKGSGFHIITHKGRYVFAIAPFALTRDAQYINICSGKKPGTIFVSGEILGRKTQMEVLVQGNTLIVDSSVAKGTFVKRAKSIEQIRSEFADLLKAL